MYNTLKAKTKVNFKAFKKKTLHCLKFSRVYIYKIVYVVIHFAIIIASYLALIRVLFVRLSPNHKYIYKIQSRKFYIRRNNNNFDSKEARRIVIAYLLP